MVYVPVQCPHYQRTAVIKAGKPMGSAVIGVTTSYAHGGSFSSTTRIAAGYPRSAARWSTWLSMVVVSATPPAYCEPVPRP